MSEAIAECENLPSNLELTVSFSSKKIKMVHLDLDGTLVESRENGITGSGIQAVDNFFSQNKIVVFSSGMPYSEMEDILCRSSKEYLKNPNSLIVSENGGLLYNPRTKEKKVLCPVNMFEVVQIKNQIIEDCVSNTKNSYFCNGRLISFEEPKKTVVTLLTENSEDVSLLADYLRQKISIYPGVFDVLEHRGNVPSAEIVRKDLGKGSAVEVLSRQYNILPENVLAVGNGDNDISMFKAAGYAIAVGNSSLKAKKTVKEHSNGYVSSGNIGSGVLEGISYFMS